MKQAVDQVSTVQKKGEGRVAAPLNYHIYKFGRFSQFSLLSLFVLVNGYIYYSIFSIHKKKKKMFFSMLDAYGKFACLEEGKIRGGRV